MSLVARMSQSQAGEILFVTSTRPSAMTTRSRLLPDFPSGAARGLRSTILSSSDVTGVKEIVISCLFLEPNRLLQGTSATARVGSSDP